MISVSEKKTQKTNWKKRLKEWKEQATREQNFQELVSKHLNQLSTKKRLQENRE
jgi:hypothetical protein